MIDARRRIHIRRRCPCARLSGRVGRDRAEWLLRDGWFNALYQNPNARLATAEDLIESMDRAGVDHSIVCGFPWSDDAHCAFHNEYMADAARRFPDRISWLAIVAPGNHAGQSAEECLSRVRSASASSTPTRRDSSGPKHPGLPRSPRQRKSFDRPIMVHASEPLGHDYPAREGRRRTSCWRWPRPSRSYGLLRRTGAVGCRSSS